MVHPPMEPNMRKSLEELGATRAQQAMLLELDQQTHHQRSSRPSIAPDETHLIPKLLLFPFCFLGLLPGDERIPHSYSIESDESIQNYVDAYPHVP